jgi:hypothetical protein
MKKELLLILVWVAIVGLCVFLSNMPKNYSLRAGPVIHAPMYTIVIVDNPSSMNVHIDKAIFSVTEFLDYKPSNPPDWSYDEIVFEKSNNDSGEIEPKEREFYSGRLDITIPANDMVKIRIRIKNKNYPGLRAAGKVTLKHSRGSLDIEGVRVSVESWE